VEDEGKIVTARNLYSEKPDPIMLAQMIEELDKDVEIVAAACKRITLRLEGTGIHYLPIANYSEDNARLFSLPDPPSFSNCYDCRLAIDTSVDSGDVKSFIENPDLWYARMAAVELDVYRLYLKHADERGMGRVYAGCNYKGCGSSYPVAFHSARAFVESQSRANQMLWYCHHHRLAAWETDKVLGDDVLDVLYRISKTPACSKTEALGCHGTASQILEFLDAIGLVEMRSPGDRGRSHGKYAISLTVAGTSYLKQLQQKRQVENGDAIEDH
jgi:hypothetical protein